MDNDQPWWALIDKCELILWGHEPRAGEDVEYPSAIQFYVSDNFRDVDSNRATTSHRAHKDAGVIDTSSADTTFGTVRYMDHENIHYVARAHNH